MWGDDCAKHSLIAGSGFPDSEKMAQYLEEERHMREENLRLQRKLQREMERREALCRQLSESESSLEMDDERFARMPRPALTYSPPPLSHIPCPHSHTHTPGNPVPSWLPARWPPCMWYIQVHLQAC